MPVPSTMSDLSTTAGSNSPAGTEAIGNSLDNYLRATQAILRSTYALASSTIAAASTTDLATADAESVQVTGAATITSLGTGFNGCKREVRFTGVCTITNSANIVLPGGVNITTAAGDVLTFRCTGSAVWALTAKTRTASSDVIAALGYTPANKAGDEFTGGVSVKYAAATLAVQDDAGVAAGNGGILDLSARNNSSAQVALGRIKGYLVNGTPGGEAGAIQVFTRIGGVLTLAATIDSLQNATFTGSVTSGTLELGYRDLPRVTGGLERGKCYAISGGITINTATAAYIYTIYNDSAAPVTLTQGGGLTLRLAGSTTTGSRTLAARGLATVWFNTSTEAIVSGPGVS